VSPERRRSSPRGRPPGNSGRPSPPVSTGEICDAFSRALVHGDVCDEFLATPESYVLGDPLEGATPTTGGGRPDDPALRDGHYFEPTVAGRAPSGFRSRSGADSQTGWRFKTYPIDSATGKHESRTVGRRRPPRRSGSAETARMTAVDNLWYLATEAEQRAEQRYQDLRERHDDYVEYTPRRRVSRPRFRTVAERIKARGLPYGAHTLTHHPDRGLLLVYHATVEMWVLPGGEVRPDESLTEGARRELEEEAGVDGQVRGLGILGRVQFRCDGHETWGVLPIYETDPAGTDLSVDDPDGEITDARWFEELPEGTRDRTVLEQWLDERA